MAYIKKTNNPKMGRPTSEPRSVIIRARVTENESRMLDECVQKSGLTKTDIIVKGIRLVFDELNK